MEAKLKFRGKDIRHEVDNRIPEGSLKEAGQAVGHAAEVEADRATFMLLQRGHRLRHWTMLSQVLLYVNKLLRLYLIWALPSLMSLYILLPI